MKLTGIGIGVLLVTAFMIAQPATLGLFKPAIAQELKKQHVEPFDNCLLSGVGDLGPEDPVDMNTVVTETYNRNLIPFTEVEIIKTVHKDKQIFRCKLTQVPNEPVLVEVMIVAEIFEVLSKLPNSPILYKHVQAIECQKLLFDGSVLGCRMYNPKIDSPPVLDCIPQQVDLPEEMNTVVSKLNPNQVKTIIANKEKFICAAGTKKKDVILFSEIIEDLDKLFAVKGYKHPIIKRHFESLTCVVQLDSAFVEACQFRTIQHTRI